MSGCQVDGCQRAIRAKGLCHPHYERARRNNGDPTAGVDRAGRGEVARFLAHVVDGWRAAPSEGCIPYPFGIYPNGYGQDLPHRKVLAAAKGPAPSPLRRAMALHSCHNRSCVNPEHLRWGSHMDNMDDLRNSQRACAGEANPKAKMTEAGVDELRAERRAGASLSQLGKMFGIHPSTAHDIVKGKTWKRTAS